jgi:peptidoglycan/xylan/chitin deacetylase (PgdA/CDA1 family)
MKKKYYRHSKKHQANSMKSQNAILPAIVFGFVLLVFAYLLRIDLRPLPKQNFVQAKQIALHVSASTPTPTFGKNVLGLTKVHAAEIASDYCINLPILFYHHIEPIADAQKQGHAQFTVDARIFSQQLEYLQEHGYHTVDLEIVVDAIRNHTTLPDKSLVLTFDDGYVDAYTYALPLLKQHNMTGSFMIPTGLMNNPDYMNWDQLKELATSMSVYSHTWSHANLPSDNHEKQEFEISHAQQELRDNLGKNTNIFTYPYGSFNNEVISLLQQHGYVAGLSTLPGTEQCESYLMTLHRTRIGNAPLFSYGL